MGLGHHHHRQDLEGHLLVHLQGPLVSENFQGDDLGHHAAASTGVPSAEDDCVLVADEAFLSYRRLASLEVLRVDIVAAAFQANDHEAQEERLDYLEEVALLQSLEVLAFEVDNFLGLLVVQDSFSELLVVVYPVDYLDLFPGSLEDCGQ